MSVTLAEVLVIAASIWALFRLLKPLQRRAEGMILRWLEPDRDRIIDVKPVDAKRDKD